MGSTFHKACTSEPALLFRFPLRMEIVEMRAEAFPPFFAALNEPNLVLLQ